MRSLLAAILVLALLAGTASADDPPLAQQALLVLRILAYDRNLKERSGGEKVVVAVVGKAGDRASEDAAAKVVRAIGEAARTTTVLGMPVEVIAVPFDASLDERLSRTRIAALYVAPGLEDSVGLITPLTKKYSVLSLSPRPEPPKNGLAVGMELRGARTAVIVNLQAARSEKVDFESAFLRVAEVIKP